MLIPSWLDEITAAYASDPIFKALLAKWQHGELDTTKYSCRGGILYYKGRIYLYKSFSLIPKLLQAHHDSPTGGHSGYHTTVHGLKQSFYWPGLQSSVRDYNRSCDICQRTKSLQQHPAGLLQPLPIPDKIWTHINIDFIDVLPMSMH